jgi:hypothetical protein
MVRAYTETMKAVSQLPSLQVFWAKTDQIRTKLEAGELAVGPANRLQMQASNDLNIAHAQDMSAVAAENDRAGKLRRRRFCKTRTCCVSRPTLTARWRVAW